MRCALAPTALSLAIVACWSGCAYLGVTQGLDFFSFTSSKLQRPKGSASERSRRIMGELFVQKISEYPFRHGVVITARDPELASVWSPEVAELTRLVLNSTLGACATDGTLLKDGICWWREAHGLFVPPAGAGDLDVNPSDYVTPDNRTGTLIVLHNNAHFGSVGNPPQVAAWRRLQAAIDKWVARHGEQFEVGSTHEQMVLDAAQSAIIADFARGDAVTLPIAFAILLCACGPSALLALLTLPVTLLTTLFILTQLASGAWLCRDYSHASHYCHEPFIEPPSFAPAVIIDMVIAISLDYTLFFLARFRSESSRPHPTLAHTLLATTRRASRVVLTSGFTLLFSFCGLFWCTMHVVVAIGCGGAVLCAVAMAVHLTLLPALLLLLAPPGSRAMATAMRCARACHVAALSSCRKHSCCKGDSVHGAINSIRPLAAPLVSSPIRTTPPSPPSPAAPPLADISAAAAQPQPTLQPLRLPAAAGSVSPVAAWSSPPPPPRAAAADCDRHQLDHPSSLPAIDLPPLDPANRWVRIGVFCRDHRRGVVAAITCLFIPCAVQCAFMQTSANQDQLAPRSAPSLIASQTIPRVGLSLGLLQPVYVLAHNARSPSVSLGCHDDDLDFRQTVVGHAKSLLPPSLPRDAITCASVAAVLPLCNSTLPLPGGHGATVADIAHALCPGTCPNYCSSQHANVSVLDEGLFQNLTRFRTALENLPGRLAIQPSQIRDIVTPPSNRSRHLTMADAEALLAAPAPSPYHAQFVRYTNFNQTATLVEVRLHDGPAGVIGEDQLVAIRAVAAEHNMVVAGDIPVVLDMMAAVLDQAPALLVGTMCCVAFAVSAVAFRSLLVPLRLLVTIVVTVVLVVGLTTWLYQTVFPVGGLYWLVPVSCACLMVGLSLDYDIFLISEVYDLRLAGLSTEGAILRAMGTESTTITTAGLIMTVAFSSMLLSSTTVLNEWGVLLVATSIIDTVLVRTCLVPALMFSAVDCNWWPGRLPLAQLDHNGEPLQGALSSCG